MSAPCQFAMCSTNIENATRANCRLSLSPLSLGWLSAIRGLR